MKILETERLILRECDAGDAPFVLELLNSPKFLQYIGDRKVRTVEDARRYIETRFIASYREFGHGLYSVELKHQPENDLKSKISNSESTWIGLCGLVKRPSLDCPDLGFAFLPEFEGRGYGTESARAVIGYARERLRMDRLMAITTLDNDASIALLRKLGFELLRVIEENNEQINLFELVLDSEP